MEALRPGQILKLSTKAVYDYNLVRQAVNQGNQKAYTELLSRYHESIYFMMLKICNNKDDAEDLTIEAFGKAFNKLEQYHPEFAFSTWLFKIASNNAIDFLRKKKIKHVVSIENAKEDLEGKIYSTQISSSTLNPEESFIKKQKIETLRDLVANIKPLYREMIELFYFQEMSHEEISVQLNLPIGTIKAQLFRARELLYNALRRSKLVL